MMLTNMQKPCLRVLKEESRVEEERKILTKRLGAF
jgi:hypothetical protein